MMTLTVRDSNSNAGWHVAIVVVLVVVLVTYHLPYYGIVIVINKENND